MTNYEKIKAMSVEEMATLYAGNIDCDGCPFESDCPIGYGDPTVIEECKKFVQSYLEREVEEADENMLPEICSCGYRFEADETICPNCGKKVEEDG